MMNPWSKTPQILLKTYLSDLKSALGCCNSCTDIILGGKKIEEKSKKNQNFGKILNILRPKKFFFHFERRISSYKIGQKIGIYGINCATKCFQNSFQGFFFLLEKS